MGSTSRYDRVAPAAKCSTRSPAPWRAGSRFAQPAVERRRRTAYPRHMSDRYAAWIRGKLAEHVPEATTDPAAALQLAHAWAALSGHGKEIFGMEMPAELPERVALRDECLAALKKWIPLLDKPAKEQLRQMLTAYAVPLS